MNRHFFLRRFDWTLLVIPLLLVFWSMMTFKGLGPSAGNIINRQIIFIFVGSGLFFITAIFDYRIFKNYSSSSIIFYLITILLLAFTLISSQIRGVNAWLSFGPYQFEPSELAKLAGVILLAKYFSQKHTHIYDFRHIVASGIYILIPAGFTFIQPDLGSAVVFIIIWLAMLLFSGIKRKHFLLILLAAMTVVAMGWFLVLKPYQKTRITTFLNPYVDPKGEGYSIIQSRITAGSGRLFGTTFDEDPNVPVLVPEPYTDFTFSIFAQKFGFVGVVIVFGALWFLIVRSGNIAEMADNNFAKLFVVGFFTFILVHVFINAGMNIGLLPITGIPFPFLSYGGSHFITLIIGFGLIESIRLHS